MIPHTGCHSLEKNTCLAPEVWLPVPWGLCTFPAPTSPSQTKFLQVQFTEAYLGYNSSLSDTGGFPGGSDGEASPYNEGDPGWIPGSGRSPGEGNGNPLQCSCLENPMDRPQDHKESETTEQLTCFLQRCFTRPVADTPPGFVGQTRTTASLGVAGAHSIPGRPSASVQPLCPLGQSALCSSTTRTTGEDGQPMSSELTVNRSNHTASL